MIPFSKLSLHRDVYVGGSCAYENLQGHVGITSHFANEGSLVVIQTSETTNIAVDPTSVFFLFESTPPTKY